MPTEPQQASIAPVQEARWAKVIDHTRCIGCHACSTACKSENEVPLGVHRTYVKYAEVGTFPQVKRHYQVTRCNQCDDAPCVEICPTGAMYRRRDGIVDFDKSICIGCKACMAACPYDAIFINPEDHSAEKCNFCAHRIDVGLEPACVTVCPTQAILVGDLEDPTSRVAQIAHREAVAVRRPEKGTQPKLFYVGAHQATLDPLAARRPDGGLFLWGEQAAAHDQVVSGYPRESARRPGTSSAAALLAFDVPHTIPWDWRVGLYTLTKGIAAGAYLVALMLVRLGVVAPDRGLWTTAAPLLAIAALVATAGILVADLEHPERFWMLLTRGRWRSWLVRGAWILSGYGVVLAAHVAPVLLGRAAPSWLLPLAALGAPLAALTAVYTAWLFAQAKARDLWQNPLLPPHLVFQAALLGSAILLPIATVMNNRVDLLLWTLAITSVIHLLMVWGEVSLTHPTAHARLAIWEMVRGRYKTDFWMGTALSLIGGLLPLLAVLGVVSIQIGVGGAPFALIGLMLFENAYVQAAQSVPLA